MRTLFRVCRSAPSCWLLARAFALSLAVLLAAALSALSQPPELWADWTRSAAELVIPSALAGDDKEPGNATNQADERRGGADPNAPPETVAELFRRWFAPTDNAQAKAPSPAAADWSTKVQSSEGNSLFKAAAPTPREATTAWPAPEVKPAVVKPAGQAAGQGGTGKGAKRALTVGKGEVLPSQGAFRGRELLAVNVSSDSLSRMRDQGFTVVETFTMESFEVKVTRVAPPTGADAVAARQLLHSSWPEEAFTYNYVYRPFYIAAARDWTTREEPLRQAAIDSGPTPRTQAARQTASEATYGRLLINWGPHLAACARGVRVGVVDTPIDLDHPAFREQRIEHGNILPTGKARAPNWHGTGVLSLLSGDPRSATPGLIPEAQFFLADAFFTDAGGQPVTDSISLLKALDWMHRFKVKVVNLSLAGPRDDLLHNAIQFMDSQGVVFVAAAGNDGPGAPPSYPAAYPEVIAVTAVDRSLNSYRYANQGSYIDLAAPGVGVLAALPGNKVGPQTGTSFAVPYVTALAASVYKDTGLEQGRSRLRAKEAILSRLSVADLGPVGRDPIFGLGLVRAPGTCGTPGSDLQAVSSRDVPTGINLWQVSWQRDR